MAATTQAMMAIRSIPLETVRRASSSFRAPSACAISAMQPPPKPPKRHPASMIMGKVKPMAARGSLPPSCPTK